MIEFKKDFSNQLVLLENIIEYDMFQNLDAQYSKWTVSVKHMNVIVFGDKNTPNLENIHMADRILKDIDTYENLALNRFKSWLGEDTLYECVNMEFGQIYYNDIWRWENCFSMTFVRKESVSSEWKYTAKFKDDGWPIGIEVWSEKRCSELEEKGLFIDAEEDFEDDKLIELLNNQHQQEFMKFFKEHVKINAKYSVNDNTESIISSCYCGTNKTNGCFYAVGIGQDTDNVIEDVYSNYTIKCITKNGFYPISLEFWIS